MSKNENSQKKGRWQKDARLVANGPWPGLHLEMVLAQLTSSLLWHLVFPTMCQYHSPPRALCNQINAMLNKYSVKQSSWWIPHLKKFFLPDWGQALRRPKKSLFSSTFPPNREGNTFSEKYICQICSSPCPQGRQQSTAVAADPQSPHPLPPSPPPLLPDLPQPNPASASFPLPPKSFGHRASELYGCWMPWTW